MVDVIVDQPQNFPPKRRGSREEEIIVAGNSGKIRVAEIRQKRGVPCTRRRGFIKPAVEIKRFALISNLMTDTRLVRNTYFECNGLAFRVDDDEILLAERRVVKR